MIPIRNQRRGKKNEENLACGSVVRKGEETPEKGGPVAAEVAAVPQFLRAKPDGVGFRWAERIR